MKKTTLVIAALAAVAGAHAQNAGPASSYSVTADFTYASEYIFRGVENSAAAFQPSVEIAMGDFNVGLWTNQPITKNENNEIDVYGGYKFRLSETLSLEVLGTYYWYPEARGGATKDSIEAGVGATWSISGFSPSLYYYHDFTLDADTLQAAIGYSLPLQNMGVSLDTSIYGGHVTADDAAPHAFGAKVHESYTYWGVDVNIPYRLSSSATLTVGAHYAQNRNLAGVGGPAGTLGKENVWVTAGLSVGF